LRLPIAATIRDSADRRDFAGERYLLDGTLLRGQNLWREVSPVSFAKSKTSPAPDVFTVCAKLPVGHRAGEDCAQFGGAGVAGRVQFRFSFLTGGAMWQSKSSTKVKRSGKN
jgi:hypothetical protein